MKVLVTGGTGVVGQAVVTELCRSGHAVRLLSRNATADAARWGDGVEAWPASVTDPTKIRGSAEGCDLCSARRRDRRRVTAGCDF